MACSSFDGLGRSLSARRVASRAIGSISSIRSSLSLTTMASTHSSYRHSTAPAQWPLQLARQVNARATHARVGVMPDGVVTPIASATDNRVYLSGGHRFQLDVRTPELPPPDGDYDFVYPAGIGSYIPGQTVVKGSDGQLYACRPFPEGAWCNTGADAYRPGTGSAWRDAWIPY
ncbi:MAG: hypothetical protein ACN6RH_11790 [Stenotrophomonas rhizophila]|uniref:hypothetical protein n=1 Tax=Stenotrophomonas rhizophila TaxID=216778 RepID=UPI003D10ED7D